MSFSDLSVVIRKDILSILKRREHNGTLYKPFYYFSEETGFIKVIVKRKYYDIYVYIYKQR